MEPMRLESKRLSLQTFEPCQKRLVFVCERLDVESSPEIAAKVCQFYDARVIEKQSDSDLLTWLVSIDGERFFLKVEHYSESVWLESLDELGDEMLDYLYHWSTSHADIGL